MAEPAKAFLDGLFRTAIAAAHPSSCLPAHLPDPPASGRLIVLQVFDAGSLDQAAARQRLTVIDLPARDGEDLPHAPGWTTTRRA